MFCDGECEKKNKHCGLFAELTMKNDLTGDIKQIKRCVLYAIFDSLSRQEQGQILIERAVQSSRNEAAEQMHMARDTIAKGFLGLIKEAEIRTAYLKEVQEDETKKLLKDNSIILGSARGA